MGFFVVANITFNQIVDAVETTLSAATTLVRSQSYDELTEGIQPGDCPLLQVYWESASPVSSDSSTDRRSFGGGGGDENTPLRDKAIIIHADYYATARSHIAEDMAAVVNGVDALTDVLETQNTLPYFGLAGIKSFQWQATRVTFVYGDPQTPYSGARFVITLRVY